MSTKERLPTNNTGDVESPFLSDELFAVEPKEEWELLTAALAAETPYVGGQAQFSDAMSGLERNQKLDTENLSLGEVLSDTESDRESSDATPVSKWQQEANPEASSSTMSAVSATGTTGGRNFTVNDGTVLTPTLEIFAHDLSAAFERRTGKQIHVTSGVRTPEAQARAMWTKLVANEDLTKLYRNKTAVNEVIAAAKGRPEVVAIPTMMAILTAQMGRGVYLSGHMRANSIDVRSKTMSEAEKRACEAAVAELGARWLHEGVPPHYHVDMPSAVPAHEEPSYWALGRDAWRESGTIVEREDECLLGNPDDQETFETAEAVEDTQTIQGLLGAATSECELRSTRSWESEGIAGETGIPPDLASGPNAFGLKSGENRYLSDRSFLFNNAGTLIWTSRDGKVNVTFLRDGLRRAAVWRANVPMPKSAPIIEVRQPRLFLQADLLFLEVKWRSDSKDLEVTATKKLSDRLSISHSDKGDTALKFSVDPKFLLPEPLFVSFEGALDRKAMITGQSQVGVEAGAVKGGVEAEVRVDLKRLVVEVEKTTQPVTDLIQQKTLHLPVVGPVSRAFQSVVGHEVSYETGAAPVRCSNAFGTLFQNTATGPSNVNAYLLAYLATLVYADRIGVVLPEGRDLYKSKPTTYVQERRRQFEVDLQTNPDKFREKFEKATRPLFFAADRPESATNIPPRFRFVWDKLQVLDPEVMLIETTTSVFVVFRGTDRVPGSFSYEWAEWLTTDFKGKLLPFKELSGRVHTGFWSSLGRIREELIERVKEFHGQTKKVWITGHSLGAAQAQMFAGYLLAPEISKKHQIAVQGVYAFASPRVGDKFFVDNLHKRFPRDGLQRFEFADDPVPLLPPRKLGSYDLYADAGVRNYYDTIFSYQYDADAKKPRDPADDSKALEALAGLANLKLGASFLPPSTFCFHHPNFYLRAAYAQLTKSEKERVPGYLPIPDTESAACGAREIARALGAPG
jgi:Lipase (class 3)